MTGERVPLHVWVLLGFGLAALASSALLIRFATDTPPLSVAFWRTLSGAVLLAPFALARSRDEIRRLEKRDWGFIVLAALLLSGHFITWITSLYHTSVASATVLVSTSPIFLAVLGFVLLKERFKWPVYAAIVVGVVGAALLALEKPTALAPDPSYGNGLALSAALMMTLYLLVGRVVRQRLSFLAYVFPLYVLIAVIIGVCAWIAGQPFLGLGWKAYGLCLLMALGPQVLGHGSFNYALRYVPTVLLGLLTLIEPIGATVAAHFLFDERPGFWGLVGMAVTLGAVGLAVYFEHRGARRESRAE